ncbi:MAG: hypothetical protein ACOZAA_09490 [Pseudomonadota bacterium]
MPLANCRVIQPLRNTPAKPAGSCAETINASVHRIINRRIVTDRAVCDGRFGIRFRKLQGRFQLFLSFGAHRRDVAACRKAFNFTTRYRLKRFELNGSDYVGAGHIDLAHSLKAISRQRLAVKSFSQPFAIAAARRFFSRIAHRGLTASRQSSQEYRE